MNQIKKGAALSANPGVENAENRSSSVVPSRVNYSQRAISNIREIKAKNTIDNYVGDKMLNVDSRSLSAL